MAQPRHSSAAGDDIVHPCASAWTAIRATLTRWSAKPASKRWDTDAPRDRRTWEVTKPALDMFFKQ